MAVKASRPCVESVALTADESIERIEKKCSYALKRATLFRALTSQPVKDGDHEAFRFSRPRATADDGGGRGFSAKGFPCLKLMRIGTAGRRKGIVLSQFFWWIAQTLDKTFIQQTARQIRYTNFCLSPAEGGLKGRVAYEAAFFAWSAGKHGI